MLDSGLPSIHLEELSQDPELANQHAGADETNFAYENVSISPSLLQGLFSSAVSPPTVKPQLTSGWLSSPRSEPLPIPLIPRGCGLGQPRRGAVAVGSDGGTIIETVPRHCDTDSCPSFSTWCLRLSQGQLQSCPFEPHNVLPVTGFRVKILLLSDEESLVLS